MQKFAILVVFICFAVLGIAHGLGSACFGGSREGSRISDSRYTSGRATSRISSSRSTSRSNSVRMYRSPIYSRSSRRTAAAVGTLARMTSNRRRYINVNRPDKDTVELMVCFNQDKLRNGTNGYFICPENYAYCCGDENAQKCCTYNENNEWKSTGALIGGVIGGVILLFGVNVYKKRLHIKSE